MKIAITVWNGRVAPLFDVASTVRFITVQGGSPGEQVEMTLPPGTGMIRRVSFLLEKGTDVLICGAVSNGVHRMLTASGIGVHPFISGDGDEVVEALLSGNLENSVFRMPGCGGGAGFMGGRGSCRHRKRGAKCQAETDQDPSERDPEAGSV